MICQIRIQMSKLYIKHVSRVFVLKNFYRDRSHQIVGNSTVGHYEYDYSESRSLLLVAQILSSKFPFRECLFIQMGSAVIFHKLLWPIDSGILLRCSFPQEAGRKGLYLSERTNIEIELLQLFLSISWKNSSKQFIYLYCRLCNFVIIKLR